MKRSLTHSCGILLYRVNALSGEVSVFLGKPNSPMFWGRESERVWSIPKGGVEEEDTTLLDCAKREFNEETGETAPVTDYIQLVDYKTSYGKVITIFVGEANNVDIAYRGSISAEREWPVGSGERVTYLETLDAQWFPIKEAMSLIMYGQKPILELLVNFLSPE